MTTYQLMTPGGIHCGYVDAFSDDEAITEAASRGFQPAEVTSHGDQLVVVVLRGGEKQMTAETSDFSEAAGMALHDGAAVISKRLTDAGYEVGELYGVEGDSKIGMRALLHDGPGEVIITVSLPTR